MIGDIEPKHAAPVTQDSSAEIVAAESLTSDAVRGALNYWKERRGGRRFPAREDISPRAMSPFLRNIVLIRIIDGGADYEYRIAGDAYVLAFGINFKGMRLTQIEEHDPFYGGATRAAYEYVRVTGEAFALRGWVAPTVTSAFSYHETVFLPLGENGIVDHLIAASAFTPRGNTREFSFDNRPRGGELPPGRYTTRKL